MKALTVAGLAAAVVGGYILLKNVGKASAAPVAVQRTLPAPVTAQGYAIPQWPNSYPMYEVPQGSMPKQSDVNVGLSSSGVTYSDDRLKVSLGTDFLSNIPILGSIFGSRDIQKEGIAKTAP